MGFSRYPKYKDSGVQWLGQVPEHWDVCPLKRLIGKVESGTSVNASDEPADDGKIGVLKTSCVYTGTFDPNENKTVVTEDIHRVSCPLRSGTLIVSRMNTPDLIGSAGLVTQTQNSLFLPDRLWQVSFPSASPKFVHFWTLTSLYRGQVQAACTGTSSSMKNLGQDQFGSFNFATPPLPEQTAIAAFLDRETAKIDALVAEQQRLIELLKEKRQALISHAVTKGLNSTVPMKHSGIEWLGDVPAHWELAPLRRLVAKATTITYGIVQAGPDIEGGIPYIRTSDMAGDSLPRDGYLRTTPEIDASYARSKVKANDLVVAIRASLGKGLLVPDFLAGANLTQGTARVSPGEKLSSRFFYHAFNSDYCQTSIRVVAKGTTFLEITLDALRRIPVVVPPVLEQIHIVNFIDSKTNKLDSLISESQRAIDLLQERRTALISAAVTGQIDVRNHVTA